MGWAQMSDQISFGNVAMNLQTSLSPSDAKPTKSTPFHILIMGDLSGRGTRGICEAGAALGKRRFYELDRDNVDEVLAALKVEIHVPIGKGDQTMPVAFSLLDDFHPDKLFDQLEVFSRLRQMRRRLANQATFAEAAAEMQEWAAPEKPAQETQSPPMTYTGQENLLDLVIGGAGDSTTSGVPTRPASGNDWSEIIREIVGPHVAAIPSAQQADLVARVDEATSAQMRSILHDRRFQAVESNWRGLDYLARLLETNEKLKIFVVDVTKEELQADLQNEELQQTGLYQLLVDRSVGTPGAKRWSVLVGLYEFHDETQEIEALGRLARIAALAGAPVATGANPQFLGVDKIHEAPDPDDWNTPLTPDVQAAWNALRELPESRSLALGLPRFLTRLPYGKKSSPTEKFQFEEMPETSVHEHYCWGCPALLVAAALARGYEELGWKLRPAGAVDLSGLPMHVYKEDGESVVKPCAEVLLVERAADRISDLGFVPLQSFKGGDTVRVRGVTAVANPLQPLRGPWSA